MNVLKRAWLHVRRKKVKTGILFVVLLIIATALISVSSIRKATSHLKKNFNESIQAGFTLTTQDDSGYEFTGIPVEGSVVNQMKELEGIANYNVRTKIEGYVNNISLVEQDASNVQVDEELNKKFEHIATLNGNLDTSLDSSFLTGIVSLKEGRHIQNKDQRKALIHESLAKKNGLKLGDVLELDKTNVSLGQIKGDGNDIIRLEIVGIFKGVSSARVAFKTDMLENLIYTDISSIQEYMGASQEFPYYDDATFFVSNPNQLSQIIQDARKLPINWNAHKISENGNRYMGVISSVDHMEGIINVMSIGIFVVSAIILSLMLALWIHGRIHETGVLLALGKSKWNIVSQYLLEILMIALFSFTISYFSGQVISQGVANQLVAQAQKSTQSEMMEMSGGMMFAGDAESMAMTESVKELSVTVDAKDMINVWIMGAGILVLSVFVASFMIIRMKPREILSKMS